MGEISKLFEKTDGLLLRCLGFTKQADTDIKTTQISRDIPDQPDYSSCPCDTVLVFDISFSMTYKDCHPSRLGAGQHAAETYVRTRASICPGDRIAIVSFALSAKIDLPLTNISDTESIISTLWKLKCEGGTDLESGLEAAGAILRDAENCGGRRVQRILMLTDGRGGNPLSIAREVKNRGVLIEIVGIGGKRSAVDEPLLHCAATTDNDGFTHYWFIKDADSLVKHYQQLATSLVWRSGSK